MNKTILLYGIVITCCISVLALVLIWVNKEIKSPSIVEQRDTLGINPFAVAERVELITYSNRMDWWYDENGVEQPLLQEGILNMPTDSINSRIQLDSAVVGQWHKALYETEFCEDNVIALCYEPRHMLLFYGSANKLFGYMEICLSCGGGEVSEGLREVDFCLQRVEYLAGLEPLFSKI